MWVVLGCAGRLSHTDLFLCADIYWPCVGLCQPLSRLYVSCAPFVCAIATNDMAVGIYTDQVLNSYRDKNRLEVPPHVFAVAESAYYNMKAYKDNQCVIISGESGAGKTEAAKRLMQYIASVSGGSDSSIQQTKDMVLATNPLLESFGNAKTLRNNNSSRFGKYLELEFNAQGQPIGANITNYLLEKTRVVSQITNERNFHIFYQLTKAAPQTYRGARRPQFQVFSLLSVLTRSQITLASNSLNPTSTRAARNASMCKALMIPPTSPKHSRQWESSA